MKEKSAARITGTTRAQMAVLPEWRPSRILKFLLTSVAVWRRKAMAGERGALAIGRNSDPGVQSAGVA